MYNMYLLKLCSLKKKNDQSSLCLLNNLSGFLAPYPSIPQFLLFLHPFQVLLSSFLSPLLLLLLSSRPFFFLILFLLYSSRTFLSCLLALLSAKNCLINSHKKKRQKENLLLNQSTTNLIPVVSCRKILFHFWSNNVFFFDKQAIFNCGAKVETAEKNLSERLQKKV